MGPNQAYMYVLITLLTVLAAQTCLQGLVQTRLYQTYIVYS